MTVGDVAANAGRGLFAGLAGTVAMTISSTVEMKLRNRKASSTPADAAGKVLGVEPTDETTKSRFSNLVHWSYGTAWGGVRGLLASLGLRGPAAVLAHFSSVWGAELVMLPSLGVTSPPWKWGATEVAIDAFHHAVYAGATSLAYERLSR